MAIKITNKKPLFGNRRSHACNATRHAQKPNLQTITLADGTKIKISARELRTLRKISNNVETIEEVAA
ncbi:MAG: 50S ribosomal protein L28 [Bacilli bacterium]|nr:50S ribosomal protein L28 [Bacilli bacterium]